MIRKLTLLYVLPHDKRTWEAKQNHNTIGAAVSSAADTQTEDGRFLLTSLRGVRSGPIKVCKC